MNKYKQSITFFLVIILFFTACKKSFLDVIPKGRQIASTTKDYDLLLNSSVLYAYQGGGGWQALAAMGDDVAAENSYFSSAVPSAQNAFRWNDDLYVPGDFISEISLSLPNLYTVNKVIQEVNNSVGGSASEKTALLAESRAERAWLYFTFVNFYGKPYSAATASMDPSFPIIKTANVNAGNYTRNSVQEVYDFMVEDLKAAITDLPIENIVGPTRWSKAGAEGLLGKVYLFSGRNKEALDLFNDSFRDLASKTKPARLYNYNEEFAAGGKFDPVTSDGPSNSPGLDYNDITESIIAKSFYNGPNNGNTLGSEFIVLSEKARSLFSANDLRLKFFAPQFPYQSPNTSGRLSKYSERYVRFGLQLSELLLLRAEANARIGNLVNAAEDIMVLRKNRMPEADAAIPAGVSTNQKNLLQFIFDERVREFATEGYRWLDMRRQSIDPLFSATTYSHTLYLDDTFTNTKVFILRPERLTLRLPYSIMNDNPQFKNNP
jgi:hypothetical protein